MKQTLLIPREIAEWIEYCKKNDFTILGALDPIGEFGASLAETFEGDVTKCSKWAKSNSNDFAYAWVKGYDVKEKNYYIAVPCGNNDYRRVFANSKGDLVLGGFVYNSEEVVKNLSMTSKKITERMIKSSPIAWSWQFAKELE